MIILLHNINLRSKKKKKERKKKTLIILSPLFDINQKYQVSMIRES